jgi:hypothetical protein
MYVLTAYYAVDATNELISMCHFMLFLFYYINCLYPIKMSLKVNKDLRIDFENVIYKNKNRNIDVWYSNNKVIVNTI